MTTTCKSCAAPIEWARTQKGHRIPLDPTPSETGNILLQDGIAVVIDAQSREGIDARTLRTSHFASCPDADQHRQHRRRGRAA